MADLIDTIVGRDAITFRTLNSGPSEGEPPVRLRDPGQVPGRFYLRFNVDDRPGVIAEIASILGRHQISIVLGHPARDRGGRRESSCPLVIMTHHGASEGNMSRRHEDACGLQFGRCVHERKQRVQDEESGIDDPKPTTMKYAIIIPDGCADEPQESLGGKTPLQAARLPAMDAVAAAGVVGRHEQYAAEPAAGSDVANLSLLGYNPAGIFHRPGRPRGRRPRHRAGPGRLGRPLQPGHHRRPDHEELHRRPNLDARGGRTDRAQPLAGEPRQRGAFAILCPGVGYRNLLV